MDPIPLKAVGSKVVGKWPSLQLLCFAALSFGFLKVSGWTYHYSSTVQTWNQSYYWCKINFTDMVAIQNKEEVFFLTQHLPEASTHYWIGLRKINQMWVWIGTNKSLTEHEENWAHGEPNNKKHNQDCVEIYIRRAEENGKWNDERCDRKKRALCYSVSCEDSSCNKHGDCMETVENYTCKCWPGFHGANCEKAVSCRSLHSPSHGQINCFDKFGTFQYNSVCNFSCEEGFKLTEPRSISCQNSGEWSEPIPTCKAISCTALEDPLHSRINCSDVLGEYTFKSICQFTCEEGFQLKGSNSLLCQNSGEWSESIPKCIAISCTALEDPLHGRINCSDVFGEYRFKSICQFTCEEGFQLNGSNSLLCQNSGEWSESIPKCIAVPCMALPSPKHGEVNCSDVFGEYRYKSICNVTCEDGFELQGSSSVLCQDTGEWTNSTPSCLVIERKHFNKLKEEGKKDSKYAAQNVSLQNQRQAYIEAYVLTSFGLILSGILIAYGLNYYHKKKNPGLLKVDKDKTNTFENPAFEDNDCSFDL